MKDIRESVPNFGKGKDITIKINKGKCTKKLFKKMRRLLNILKKRQIESSIR